MNLNVAIQDAQAKILEQATFTNSYKTFLPWANSIGFKINSFRYQERYLPSQIAEDYLANMGFSRNDVESECSMQMYLGSIGATMLSMNSIEDNNQFKKIKLANSAPLRMPLEKLLKARRSIRQYTGDSIPFQYLTSLIRAGNGVTWSEEVHLNNELTTTLNFKTAPSAGGIYPVEIYIASINVDQLEQGIYQYNSAEDCLVKIYEKDSLDNLLNCFSVPEDQISIKRSGFICLLVGTAAKSMYKYGNRGLAFTIHEVGAISQNIHLAVSSLGLGSVDCASYYNNEANQILNFDGVYKHLLHTIVIGVSQ